ncbi:hypothetical protein ZWY2020_022381 [Hordeum vulgare]|nr:hypothetical protein ZWY2020_022381 [Hordeum vulgare]
MMKKTTCKGRGKNIARLNKKQNASKTVLKQRPIHPGIGSEDECDDFIKFCESSSINLTKQIESKLSESVVSLASFNGRTPVFECTGIFIENLMDTIQILTSANLVKSVSEGITDNLTIKVRLPSDQVVIGSLHRCDFKYDLAVVNIRHTRSIHIQEAHLSSSHPVQFESNSKVVAVERCFSKGMFKFTNGIVIGPASDEPRKLMISTHKMNTALSGYPLVDFDGNFVGVNLRRGEMTFFVPMNKILEFLGLSATTSAADATDKPDPNSRALLDEGRDMSPHDRYLFELAKHEFGEVYEEEDYYSDSDEEFFTHTCGPAPNIGLGVPVLDVDSRLVGFSASNMQGPTKSLPRITFEKELNKIVNSKDLKHFKHLIYMAGTDMVGDVR